MAMAKQTDEPQLINVKASTILLQFLGPGERPFHPKFPHEELGRAEQMQEVHKGSDNLLLHRLMLC